MTSQSPKIDIRKSMLQVGRSLPGSLRNILQSILTWITGKALPEQRPLRRLNSWTHLFGMLFMLIGCAAISVSFVLAGGGYVLLLPVSVGLTLSASRALWLTDLHAAAHGSFSTNRRANKLVGDAVSLIMLVLPWAHYRLSHCVDHHSYRTFCSPDKDPDGAFLYWMGLKPGLPKNDLWYRLILGILSPRVHLVFLTARLKSNLYDSGLVRTFATLVYLSVLVGVGLQIGGFALFIAWLLPVGLLYQISAVVGWAGEHAWFAPKTNNLKEWQETRTHGRFFGVAYPQSASTRQRFWWAVLMTGQLAERLLVVPGDLPNHDWHHRHPASRDWPHAAYARQDAIEKGESYPLETWGLVNAIDHGLSSISAQSSFQARSSTTEAMTTFGAM